MRKCQGADIAAIKLSSDLDLTDEKKMRIVVPTSNERDRVFYRLRIGVQGEQWVEPFNGVEACKGCRANTERAFVNHSEVCRCRTWL